MSRVTVICEGLTPADPLFQALLDSGVGNIVCDTEIAAIQQEIAECLSETGMTRYSPKERPAPVGGVKYRFDCQNIRIAVVGSQPRIGVTTAAISLCHWLQGVAPRPVMWRTTKAGFSRFLPEAMAWSRTGMAGVLKGCSTAGRSRKRRFILLYGIWAVRE